MREKPMNKHAKGTNQYRIKHRYHFYSSVWFIAFLILLGVLYFKLTEPKIISPIPESYLVEQVQAIDAPTIQTVRERVILAAIRTWGTNNAESMEKLVFKESGFNYMSVNTDSGACGLFQANKCSKMKCELVDVDCQIKWGVDYISKRYGDANSAWSFHLLHGYY